MNTDDLRAISQLGQALWAEPGRSERLALETFAAVALLDLPQDKTIERTGQALLSRAMREGSGATGPGIHNAFYRLSPEERFILAALHYPRWSYARLGRILLKTPEQIAEIAWASRLYLVSVPGQQKPVPHPTGTGFNALQCPEYNPARPWTQSFLDDEIANREKVFLQEHLLACASCRQSLSTCRSVYYTAGAAIPRVSDETRRVAALEGAAKASRASRDPLQGSIVESILIFLARPDTRLFLLFFVGLLIAICAVRPHTG